MFVPKSCNIWSEIDLTTAVLFKYPMLQHIDKNIKNVAAVAS